MITWRNLRRRAPHMDGLAIGLVAVLLLLFASEEDSQVGGIAPRALDATAFGILIVAVALLGLRRRMPGTVALAVLGLSVMWYGTGYTSGLINAPHLMAFFTLGATGDRRRQLGVGAAAVMFLFAASMASNESWASSVDPVGWTMVAILVGEVVHARREALEGFAERAERAEAERDARVAWAERRAAQERLGIARDLHDVLAHTVSAMTVQAGLAADALDREPSTARAAVSSIRSAGIEAMSEVKAMVGVLRDGRASIDIAPAPSLERIEEVVRRGRTAGLEIAVDAEGLERPLPPLVELTAYRIVQEALTNVVRHAGASHVWVRLRRERAGVLVEVRDDGRGRPAGTTFETGFGLQGMAERVDSLGGSLSHGPCPDGGFAVRAMLPVKEPRS